MKHAWAGVGTGRDGRKVSFIQYSVHILNFWCDDTMHDVAVVGMAWSHGVSFLLLFLRLKLSVWPMILIGEFELVRVTLSLHSLD